MTRVEWPRALLMPALVAGEDGVVWMGSASEALTEINDRVVQHPDVPAGVECAYRDLDGGLWFGGRGGLWRQKAGRFDRVNLPAEYGVVKCQSMAVDRAGMLWLSMGGPSAQGVFRVRGSAWERFEPPTGVGPGNPEVITSDLLTAYRTVVSYQCTESSYRTPRVARCEHACRLTDAGPMNTWARPHWHKKKRRALIRTSHTRTTQDQRETGPRVITRSRREQCEEYALFIATQREPTGAGRDRPVVSVQSRSQEATTTCPPGSAGSVGRPRVHSRVRGV